MSRRSPARALASTPREQTRAVVTPEARERKLVEAARKLQRRSRERQRIFRDPLFANPCWDMMIETFVAEAHGAGLTIMDACLAAGTPKTSALRHISALCSKGLLARTPNPNDQRSSLLTLTAEGHGQLRAYLESVSR